MELVTAADVNLYLENEQIVPRHAIREISPLNGGVSSSVWKIVTGENRWVLKQALAKLKVKADWYSDIERIHREHEVMQALSIDTPGYSIPKILHTDYINHVYMMACADDSAQTWKEMLMSGDFNTTIAERAAAMLSFLHNSSREINEAEKEKFSDQKYFIQLRVDPFHRYVLQQYPWLNSYINKLIGEVTGKKICLVHGDFSPKNMLIEKNNHFVLIDFEVAHWGNPVFDIAYCLGHLMLKGWHLNRKQEALELITVFLETYHTTVDNLLPHLGLMLLARMDGKSPVNYITDENVKNIIRSIAVEWIKKEGKSRSVLQSIERAYG